MSYRIGLLDVAGCVLSYDYLYVSSDLSFEPSQILVQKDHCRDSISQLKYSRCLRLTAKKKESPHNIAQTLGDLYKHFRTRTWVTSVTSVTSWKCGRKKKNLAKMPKCPQTSGLFVNRLSPSFSGHLQNSYLKKPVQKFSRHQIIFFRPLPRCRAFSRVCKIRASKWHPKGGFFAAEKWPVEQPA